MGLSCRSFNSSALIRKEVAREGITYFNSFTFTYKEALCNTTS